MTQKAIDLHLRAVCSSTRGGTFCATCFAPRTNPTCTLYRGKLQQQHATAARAAATTTTTTITTTTKIAVPVCVCVCVCVCLSVCLSVRCRDTRTLADKSKSSGLTPSYFRQVSTTLTVQQPVHEEPWGWERKLLWPVTHLSPLNRTRVLLVFVVTRHKFRQGPICIFVFLFGLKQFVWMKHKIRT